MAVQQGAHLLFTMPVDFRTRGGCGDGEVLDDTGEPEVVRERIANRIIVAARLGERDPARLLEAALRRRD